MNWKSTQTFLHRLLFSLTLLLFIGNFSGKAQTTLAQGDISIIGIKSTVVRGISFVTWVNLSAGTEIRFTDNGFNSTAASNFTNNVRWAETVLIWTATSAVPAGTVITVLDETASTGTANAVNSNGADIVTVLNLSNTGGDQVFAYQGPNLPETTTGTVGNPLTFNNTILFGIGYQAGSVNTSWLTIGTTLTATSYLPSDLSASNAIYLAGNATVGEYTGARTGMANAAAYKAAIANTANWTTASGTGATLTFTTTAFTLGVAPTISANPSNSAICSGSNTSFSITANNATSYQWQENSGSGFTNITNGGVYSNATTATLTLTGPTAGMSGYLYRCVATGTASPAATSSYAMLTINSAPNTVSNPGSSSVCAGGNTSFSASFTSATGYTWQVNTGSGFSNISNGGVYSGATTTTLSITGATAGMNGFMYRIVATGSCTPARTSSSATLTVSSAPQVTQNPFPSVICEGDATLFYIAATNATGYQWQENTGSGYSNLSNGLLYSGATSSVLIINGATTSMSGNTYRCVVSGSCSPSASSTGAAMTVLANVTYYEDWDNDGYGNIAVTTVSCSGAPGGFVANHDDCDDNNASVYPGATEVCDGADNDCNGLTDDVSSFTWTGSINTDWSNPGNWGCGNVPTATTNVVINAGGNQPIVDITNAVCNNLTIATGASLMITSGNALDIKGNVINNGTFTTLGEAEFSGASQTLPGGSFHNLTISGTGTKTLGGNISVSGVLTLNSSLLELGNYDLGVAAAGSIAGGSASSFVVTNGTGSLRQSGIGAGSRMGAILFPVGTNGSSYTPVSVDNTTGTSDEFMVRVIPGMNKTYDAGGNPTGDAQLNFNVDRTWLVSEFNTGGSNVTLTFQWNGAEEQPGFIRSSCFAGHFTGSFWQRGPASQVAAGSDPYTLSLSGITSFSPFGVGSAGSTLPVTLLNFRVNAVAGNALLQWKSENELLVSHYDIQRSTDGVSFVSVGQKGAINTGGAHNYTFTDAVQAGRNYYYRLKLVDKDGKYSYSGIVLFATGKLLDGITVYPNPVLDKANLTVTISTAANANFSLMDNSGRIIRQWKQDLSAGSTAMQISLEGITAGIYHLEMKAGAVNKRIKLMKQ